MRIITILCVSVCVFVTLYVFFLFSEFDNKFVSCFSFFLSLLQGVKIKMDDAGNILIRRYSKTNVYVKSTATNPNDETAIGAEILKLPNNALESEKIVKVSVSQSARNTPNLHTLCCIKFKCQLNYAII